MDENDVLRQIGTITLGEDLYGLSRDELKARIEALEVEKSRVKKELEKKQSERSAADTLFGPKP
ncbi:DUF1192 family protein [Litorimonas haliclonae]|uniref:DUF1192 family protein n=1 Tax=Litorimonas haliclonae TaxID=2081977 RepID=UPI0039EF2D9A